MQADMWTLYELMLRSRTFEEAVKQLWEAGLISGEMHLGTGEEAVCAAIVAQMQPGDALAAGMLRPGTLAVAFFGEGAANQGMLLESLNLAAAWKMPVLFVRKDNRWEISTPAAAALSGQLSERARAFGLHTLEVDGSDVEAMWKAASEGIKRARQGEGPTFLHTHCPHLDGHFLGDQLIRIAHRPIREMLRITWPILSSLFSLKGAYLPQRIHALTSILQLIWNMRTDLSRAVSADPLARTGTQLLYDTGRLEALESRIKDETQQLVQAAISTA